MDAWFKNAEQLKEMARAKAEELSNEARKKAEELKEGATLLSESVGALSGSGNDTAKVKDVEFVSMQMGFKLEGTIVLHIEPDGQAERLGISVGDRLVKVAGYPLPDYNFGDRQGEKEAERAAKRMLREMPPPVKMTFAPPPEMASQTDGDNTNESPKHEEQSGVALEEEAAVAISESAGWDDVDFEEVPDRGSDLGGTVEAETARCSEAPDGEAHRADEPTAEVPAEIAALIPDADADRKQETERSSAPPVEATDLQSTPAEIAAPVAVSTPTAKEIAAPVAVSTPTAKGVSADSVARLQKLEGELQREREKRQKLTADLRQARQEKAILTANLEAEKKQSASHEKRAAELAEEVEQYKSQNAELLLSASKGEADNDAARDAWEGREKILQRKLQDLEAALESAKTAGKACADEAAKDAVASAAAAEARASIAEARAEELRERVAEQKKALDDLMVENLKVTEAQAAAQVRLGELDRGMGGFQKAHDAELELFRDEQERLQRKVAQLVVENERFCAREQDAIEQLEGVRKELEESQRTEAIHRASVEAAAVDVEAAAVEANAARTAATEAEEKLAEFLRQRAAEAERASRVIEDTSEGEETADDNDEENASPAKLESGTFAGEPTTPASESTALYKRIDLLQARCSALQEKLIQQRNASASGAGAGQRIPVWLPFVQKVAGPKAGQVSVLLYGSVDRMLRGLTQRLLARDMWLWLFYAHLVVLYSISGSCMATAAPDPNSPMRAINQHLEKSKLPVPPR